jgi:diguanylate cyclase (GGDEF)-like protein
LLNRRGLDRRLKILSLALTEEEGLAILHIDLDRFKVVNDICGHDAGDFVLKEAAKILSAIDPKPAAVARVGGDEFVVVFSGITHEDESLAMANVFIAGLCKPMEYQLQSLQIGASIGVAFATIDDVDALPSVITASDIALCEAKRAGGNVAVLFKPQMRDDITKNLELAEDIRRGLAADEFFPFFQPQLDTSTGKVVGFEALIRWRHPERGMIPAYQFLEVAQRIGLTDSLDNLVMDKSCKAARDLLDWGMSPVQVSINLSSAQVSDPQILSRLNTYMTKHEVGRDNIRIELLESTLLDDRASIIVNNVRGLIKAGFKVELDDFGTGHAAIATLCKIDVARIKVDRSLVQNIDKDRGLQVITSALIELAKNLGVAALAEGVETKEEQAMLTSMGCFVAQGYLHAKPMPLEQIRTWLKGRGDISESAPLLPA